MNKSKLIKKRGSVIFEIRSQKGQQLMERELYGINQNEIPGLLRISAARKGSGVILRYDLTGYQTLKEYLQTPLKREHFTQLLQSILNTLQEMRAAVYNIGCLLMDMDYILVNPTNRTVFFLFVPLSSLDNATTLQNMLLNIVKYATFSNNESTDYVQEYITILNRGINFSTFELEQYVDRLSGRSSVVEDVTCPQCRHQISAGACYCANCGCKLVGKSESLRKLIYDPQTERAVSMSMDNAAPIDENDVSRLAEKRMTGNTDDISTVTSGGTTVLGEMDGTTVLDDSKAQPHQYPYLIREKTGEKITINKPSFRLGKERQYCDYFVSDNSAVSRSHADIIERNGRYFVMDRNSTNRTYVDGKVIRPEQEVELFHGTALRLANENFTFYQE